MTATLSLLTLLAAQQSAPDAEPLPAYWHGSWSGTLKIMPEKGEPQEVAMTLEIYPIPETPRYAFRLVYGAGEKGQNRDYELVPKKDRPGRFEIDEKNGIRLEAKLSGNTLYSMFQVGGAMVLSRYERQGDVLRVEMTAFDTTDPTTTKPTGGTASVKSFPPTSIQTAELRRQKP